MKVMKYRAASNHIGPYVLVPGVHVLSRSESSVCSWSTLNIGSIHKSQSLNAEYQGCNWVLVVSIVPFLTCVLGVRAKVVSWHLCYVQTPFLSDHREWVQVVILNPMANVHVALRYFQCWLIQCRSVLMVHKHANRDEPLLQFEYMSYFSLVVHFKGKDSRYFSNSSGSLDASSLSWRSCWYSLWSTLLCPSWF